MRDLSPIHRTDSGSKPIHRKQSNASVSEATAGTIIAGLMVLSNLRPHARYTVDLHSGPRYGWDTREAAPTRVCVWHRKVAFQAKISLSLLFVYRGRTSRNGSDTGNTGEGVHLGPMPHRNEQKVWAFDSLRFARYTIILYVRRGCIFAGQPSSYVFVDLPACSVPTILYTID